MISQEAVDLFIDVLAERRKQLQSTVADEENSSYKLLIQETECSQIASELFHRLEQDYTGYRATELFVRFLAKSK